MVCLGVIRHSVRLDDDENASWPDQDARPYDTPITDTELPARRAEDLRAFGFKKVVSSPFRRCVHTAAVLAESLGVQEVSIDRGIGESMPCVMRCGWPGRDHDLTYMTDGEMHTILSSRGLKLGNTIGEKPNKDEIAARRIRQSLMTAAKSAADDDINTLLVSHGEAVGQLVEIVTGKVVVELDFCGWVVVDVQKTGPSECEAQMKMVQGGGYKSMVLDLAGL